MSARPAVRVLVAVGTALGVWVACSGGLNVDEGNAFPCDFRQAEEVRDQQCPPQWRCGIDGRCHEAEDELSPLTKQPIFEGARRFPKLLIGDTRFTAAEAQDRHLLTGYEDGGVYLVQGPEVRPLSGLSDARAVAFAGPYLLVQPELRGGVSRLRVHSLSVDAGVLGTEREVRDEANQAVTDVKALRALSFGPRVAFSVLRAGGMAGEVDPVTARYTAFPQAFSVKSDGSVTTCALSGAGCTPGTTVVAGYYTEVRHVPFIHIANQRQQETYKDTPLVLSQLVPVVVTASYVFWRELAPSQLSSLGKWQVLYTSELGGETPPSPPDGGGPPPDGGQSPPPPPPLPDGGLFDTVLRHSERANLWAMKRSMTGRDGRFERDVLSTLELSRAPSLSGPAMSLAWDDCAPCGEGRLIAFTPVTDGALGVEVLCESRRGARALFRVVGSSVVAPRDPCLVQPLEAPFDLKELASRRDAGFSYAKAEAMDDSRGAALVLGGAHGQIWAGGSLSQMRPVFLDRTPVAAESFQGGLLAFTSDFIALGPPDNNERGAMSVVMAGPPDSGTSGSLDLGNVVQGVPGWLLGAHGQIVKIERQAQELAVSTGYGPRLVGPSGQSATGPFLGQGLTFDGGVSMVLTANDQLYYVDLFKEELREEADEVRTLTPRLTPEANFPVRSLARDQTASLAGATEARVRGWASTDRSVFQFEQLTATGGWTMEPLSIGDGEPVEVWSREAGSTSYGRLGLRDGLVLRLPQGLPLTQKLPGDERVVDYASLAGWPMALGEQGIYRTVPTTLSSGAPGPMKWEPIEPLPEGLTVEDLEGARITVLSDRGRPTLYLFTRTGFVYRLAEAAR